MKVGDWVYTKKEIVLNFGGYGSVCQPSELKIDAGVLGQVICKIPSHERSVPRFDVRIPIVPMVSLTVLLREDDLILTVDNLIFYKNT